MLSVMCPNCQHRFPAPGCCNLSVQEENNSLPVSQFPKNALFYTGGGLLVPQGLTSGNGNFINAPTIVHGPTIIQTGDQVGLTNPTIKIVPSNCCDPLKNPSQNSSLNNEGDSSNRSKETYSSSNHVKLFRTGYEFPGSVSDLVPPAACHITTNRKHKGGSVTITTPRNQSGSCLIECIDSGVLFQSPIEMNAQQSGGGCLIQSRIANDITEDIGPIMSEEELQNLLSPRLVENDISSVSFESTAITLPSGCQELPGIRRSNNNTTTHEKHHLPRTKNNNVEQRSIMNEEVEEFQNRVINPILTVEQNCCNNKENNQQCSRIGNSIERMTNKDLKIQVNATLELPANFGKCTVNITATTTDPMNNNLDNSSGRSLNNFNGGGIIQPEEDSMIDSSNLERREVTSSTPVSWLMPCPWSFDNYIMDKDVSLLQRVKKLLLTTGWYYQDLDWRKSENLLKDAPIGRWIMRDSSDDRYTFAITVQTSRGPTSVRVHFFLGRFRLDAEARLAMAMPLFTCPIKMLEYYVDYSKRMDEQKYEVWIDYRGEIYSQVYMTKPLVKEVRPLMHLARLVVNANKLPKAHLPSVIKKYLAEYPYSI